MRPRSGKWIQAALMLLLFTGVAFIARPNAQGQTFVSGKVLTTDGMVVASGAVALEKGELHNNAFLIGGAIGSDGTFKIPLPAGGPWGLHVYSEGYIYFPVQLQIEAGADNEIPVILPVDGIKEDDPRISNIRFVKISDQVLQIKMKVEDPNHNLGPQMLAVDTRRFRSYRLVATSGDLEDKKADFPEGEYESPFIPLPLDGEDLINWFFVVADHQCSSGPIYNGLNQSVYQPPVAHAEKLKCEVAGVWKSNFDKIYQFSPEGSGKFGGKQFEGDILIDNINQKTHAVAMEFRFKGEKGQADLQLVCDENQIRLQGRFRLPNRSGDWVFTKLQNAKPAGSGKDLFTANCSGCHYHDRKDTRVGPGLAGLFQRSNLPVSGLPVSVETVRNQIINGGKKMPPFKHLKEEEIEAIIAYLKSL